MIACRYGRKVHAAAYVNTAPFVIKSACASSVYTALAAVTRTTSTVPRRYKREGTEMMRYVGDGVERYNSRAASHSARPRPLVRWHVASTKVRIRCLRTPQAAALSCLVSVVSVYDASRRRSRQLASRGARYDRQYARRSSSLVMARQARKAEIINAHCTVRRQEAFARQIQRHARSHKPEGRGLVGMARVTNNGNRMGRMLKWCAV